MPPWGCFPGEIKIGMRAPHLMFGKIKSRVQWSFLLIFARKRLHAERTRWYILPMLKRYEELTPAMAKTLYEEFRVTTQVGVTHCSDDPIENIKIVLDCACDDRQIGDIEESFLLFVLGAE